MMVITYQAHRWPPPSEVPGKKVARVRQDAWSYEPDGIKGVSGVG
ncbi:MAG: hypothetical protein AAF393_13725 [Pseudomonadota bacterium]